MQKTKQQNLEDAASKYQQICSVYMDAMTDEPCLCHDSVELLLKCQPFLVVD
jgi:hypothetical protein